MSSAEEELSLATTSRPSFSAALAKASPTPEEYGSPVPYSTATFLTFKGFLKKSKEELFNLRFQSATGQLDNTARLKAVKHDIARMYTVLRERELGISQAPEATDTKAEEK